MSNASTKNRQNEFKIGDLAYVSVESYWNGWPCMVPVADNGMILAKIASYDDKPIKWEPRTKHYKECRSCTCPAYDLDNPDEKAEYAQEKDHQENWRVRHPWILNPVASKYSWATLIAKPEWLKKYSG